MIQIQQLKYERFRGQTYHAAVTSDRYLSIDRSEQGFTLQWKTCAEPIQRSLDDEMLSSWLEDPVAYGAYDGSELLGFTEGFHEKWNNRFRITNICVFDAQKRRSGIGQLLMDRITIDAKNSGARMLVLETQSFNASAIRFYEKNGFEIIGFDLYAYSNDGPDARNVRIEMAKKL